MMAMAYVAEPPTYALGRPEKPKKDSKLKAEKRARHEAKLARRARRAGWVE